MTDRRPSGRHVFHEKVSASLIVFFSVGLVDCLFFCRVGLRPGREFLNGIESEGVETIIRTVIGIGIGMRFL
jgi:hypothetical protein